MAAENRYYGLPLFQATSEFSCSVVSEDVKIDVVPTQTRMERRLIRMEQLTKRFTSNPNPNPSSLLATSSSSSSKSTKEESLDHTNSEEENVIGAHRFMDLDFYKAVIKDDVDGFIDTLERVLTEKELPLRAIFEQESPAGNSLLHIAASFDNCDTVRLIAKHSPWLLSKKNFKGDTPLHSAARAGYLSTVMKLLVLNSSEPEAESESIIFSLCLRAQNEEGNIALHEALINGHEMLAFSLIYMLMQEPEPLYYLNNEEGKSPLYLATEACFYGCVSTMLDQIIKFDNQYGKLQGKSPVQAAIMKQNTGDTPLHIAARAGYLSTVMKLLVLNSSEPEAESESITFLLCLKAQNEEGNTALHEALINGHEMLAFSLIYMLMQEPEPLYYLNNEEGKSPLYLATEACF
nr:isoform 2 of ankyrin repeat domain-containing protein 6 [Quercus suber]